jgi:hypothetical protein
MSIPCRSGQSLILAGLYNIQPGASARPTGCWSQPFQDDSRPALVPRPSPSPSHLLPRASSRVVGHLMPVLPLRQHGAVSIQGGLCCCLLLCF